MISWHVISGGFTAADSILAAIGEREVATLTRHKRGWNVRFPGISYPHWRPSQRQARRLVESYAEFHNLTEDAPC